MNRRPLPLCLVVAAGGLLAVPAGALADSSLTAGPVKVKGYALNLTATDGAADSLSVMATKSAGDAHQTHMWTFKDVAVSIKGGTATIKGNLGRYGAIDAKVKTGRTTKGVVPAGCTGTAGNVRSGQLTGKTKLVLDDTFFRTVAPKKIKAQILGGGQLDCSGSGGTGSAGGQQASGLTLTGSAQDGGGQLVVSVAKAEGKVTQSVMRSDDAAATAPASVVHFITAVTGAGGLSAAADLSTATAPGAGAFLAGTLGFAGTPSGTLASGTLSGDFAARFDSIGTQTLPADTTGILLQR